MNALLLGVFTGVWPDRGWGAVELAARVSHLDLFDETVRGGRVVNSTAGVNWYVTRNVRLMFNYVSANVKRRGDRLEDDPQLFLFRFMVFMRYAESRDPGGARLRREALPPDTRLDDCLLFRADGDEGAAVAVHLAPRSRFGLARHPELFAEPLPGGAYPVLRIE